MFRLKAFPTAFLLAALCAPAGTRRFYPDDPLVQEPEPQRVEKPRRRSFNEYYDFFLNSFFDPGEEQPQKGPPIRAGAVNTLGEPLESDSWFRARHGKKRLTPEELLRGAGTDRRPSEAGPWTVTGGKNEGITPGLTIRDAAGNRYLLKFDPLSNPEMASAADVIGSKIFHALGYNVPENYIVNFRRDRLQVSPKATIDDPRGKTRPMTERDIDAILAKAPRDAQGNFRALASYFIPGELIGPFRYHGVRRDDPNDIVPHEHRRDLRAIGVFAAWINHSDSKSINSLCSVVEDKGLRYIRHYLIDFGASLGSDSFEAKSPRAGHVYLYDFKPAASQFLTLGLYVPPYARADYPELPSVGRFEAERFDPLRWKPNYPNPAFDNALPDDRFWAARQVMSFRDEDIATLVSTGQYSNPDAARHVTNILIARRDKIGRAFFSRVLPLDNFRIQEGRLEFDDISMKYKFSEPREYTVQWSVLDNESGASRPIPGSAGFSLPGHKGPYLAALIADPETKLDMTVYLRRGGSSVDVVGIERRW
jgi:hypothetical protein